MEIKNYGFIEPFIFPEEYVLGAIGSLPEEVLVPDGNWNPWRTEGERQRNESFDSSNCTGYGTAKQIRTYMKRKFGIDFNPSERWIGIIANTRPPGNSPQVVYEAIRKYGLIPEEMLPFDDTIQSVEDYYSFNGSSEKECRLEAREWFKKYSFKHEWLFYPTAEIGYKKKKLKEGLMFSPITVSVYAWKQRNGKYFKERGEKDTHWSMIEQPEWIIFDSYIEFEKQLESEFDFGFAKRIFIEEKTKKECWLRRLLKRKPAYRTIE